MKSSKRVRIIAAVDEGIFSQVAASILRNQDYDLIAVHFYIDLEKLGMNPSEFPAALQKSNLTQIEKFCAGIDVPLRVIDITEEVLAKVYDPFWMATLTGAPSAPTLDWVSGFLIPKLSTLARDYKADFFSTGHLARKHDEKQGGVLRYLDPLLDQSASFSRLHSYLSPEILSRLILPLGEVSLDRLARLAQEMGLLKKPNREADEPETPSGLEELLLNHEHRRRWLFTPTLLQNPGVHARAPGDFFKPGPIQSHEEPGLPDHPGIPFFKVGDALAEYPGQVVLEVRNPSRTLVIGPALKLLARRAFIQDLVWNVRPKSSVNNLKLQVEAFGSNPIGEGSLMLYPGNLGELSLTAPLPGLYAGRWLTFYDGAWILGAGKVSEVRGDFEAQFQIEKNAEAE